MASWRGLGRGLTAASQALTGLPGIFAELGKEERADRIRAEDRAERGFQRLSELKGDVYNDIAQGNPLSQVLAEASEIIERSGLATTDDETQKLLDGVEESYRGSAKLYTANYQSRRREAISSSADPHALRRALAPIREESRKVSELLGEDPDEVFAVPEIEEVEPITETTRVPVDLPEEGEGVQIGDPSWAGGAVEAEFDLRGAEAGLERKLQQKAEDDVYLEPYQHTIEETRLGHKAQRAEQLREEGRLDDRSFAAFKKQADYSEAQGARVAIGLHTETQEPVFIDKYALGMINQLDPAHQGRVWAEIMDSTPEIQRAAERANVTMLRGNPEAFMGLVGPGASRNRVLAALDKARVPPEDQKEAIESYQRGGTVSEILRKALDQAYGPYQESMVIDFRESMEEVRTRLMLESLTYSQAGGGLYGGAGGRGPMQILDQSSIGTIRWNTAVMASFLLMGVKADATSIYGEKRGLEIAHQAFYSLDPDLQKIIDAEDNAGVWGSLDTRWILEDLGDLGDYTPDEGVWVRSMGYGQAGLSFEDQYVRKPYGSRDELTPEEEASVAAKPEVVPFIEHSALQLVQPRLVHINPYALDLQAARAAGLSTESIELKFDRWMKRAWGQPSPNEVALVDSPGTPVAQEIDAVVGANRHFRNVLVERQQIAHGVPGPGEVPVSRDGSPLYGNPVDPNDPNNSDEQQKIAALQKEGIEKYLEAEKQILIFMNGMARTAHPLTRDHWIQALDDPNLSWPTDNPPVDFQYARQSLLELQSFLMVYMPNMEQEIPLSQFNPLWGQAPSPFRTGR